MGDPKDDASTDIDTVAGKFAKDVTAEAEKLRKARLDAQKKAGGDAKKQPAVPVVTFSVGASKTSKSRTPKEQAELLSGGSTQVCWSAHMADKARDLIMKVDGKVSWEPKDAFDDDFDTFKKKWGEAMKKNGLKNAGGGDGWPSWDEFHVELPDSKVAQSDARATACIAEYARLTREEGKKQNPKFEKDYAKLLEPYLAKYEKKTNNAPPGCRPGVPGP
jgi:hypothetical protein